MGAFADLRASATIMRQGNSDILTASAYPDATLLALNLEQAQSDLKQSMILFCRITDEESTLFDDYVTQFELTIQTGLMYRQLFWFYFLLNEGAETKSNERMNYYAKKYAEFEGKLAKMQLYGRNTTQIRSISIG